MCRWAHFHKMYTLAKVILACFFNLFKVKIVHQNAFIYVEVYIGMFESLLSSETDIGRVAEHICLVVLERYTCVSLALLLD